MPRKSTSVYAKRGTDSPTSEDEVVTGNPHNAAQGEQPPVAPAPAPPAPAGPRAQRNVIIAEDLFLRMTDQMQLITDGLVLNRAEVEQQREEIDGAKTELATARSALVQSWADLTRARHNQAALHDQYAQQDTGYQFSRNGNREQFRFNVSVLNSITEAATALEEDRIGEARHFIRQGTGRITQRNKHIKLADASTVGWAFIDEYTQSDLADNEEDNKRIRRAEAAAIAKRKRKQDSNQQRGKGSRQGSSGRGRGSDASSAGEGSDIVVNRDPLSWFLQSAAQAAQAVAAAPAAAAAPVAVAAPQAAPYSSKKTLGPCYYCGGPHLQAQCPLWKQQQAIVQAHQAQLDQADNNQKDNK
jgi:hypothetical protein